MRLILTVFTTNRFTLPIAFALTSPTKTLSCVTCFDFARREGSTHRVGVCGASLGAYHAANIAFRHADAVSHLISLSGAFEISDFFDGYHDDNIYFNSPYEYLPNMPTRGSIQPHEHHSRDRRMG